MVIFLQLYQFDVSHNTIRPGLGLYSTAHIKPTYMGGGGRGVMVSWCMAG